MAALFVLVLVDETLGGGKKQASRAAREGRVGGVGGLRSRVHLLAQGLALRDAGRVGFFHSVAAAADAR